MEEAVQRARFFSMEQVGSWARMDREVEDSKDAWEQAAERRRIDSRTQGEVRRAERERAEREEAERASPNLFFREPRDEYIRRSGGREADRERDYYADEGDDDGIDSSWRNFPVDRAAATRREREARAPPARQQEREEEYEPWAALDEAEVEAGDRMRTRAQSLYGEDDRRGGRGREDDGPVVLPKRPSFANPFKIRRAGRTKAEKAGRDTPHPMLAFRKK